MNNEAHKMKGCLGAIAAFFFGLVVGTNGKPEKVIWSLIRCVNEIGEYLDRSVDGTALMMHLNDVWLSNTPTDTDDPEKAKMKENVCLGIQYAMSALEEALGESEKKEGETNATDGS